MCSLHNLLFQMTVEDKRNEIERIANAVYNHRKLELKQFIKRYAIARIECNLEDKTGVESAIYWMLSSSELDNCLQEPSEGYVISKNSALGELFIKELSGKHDYPMLFKSEGLNRSVEIINRAIWVNQGNKLTQNDVVELLFNINGGEPYMFESLLDLMSKLSSQKKKKESLGQEVNNNIEKLGQLKSEKEKRLAAIRNAVFKEEAKRKLSNSPISEFGFVKEDALKVESSMGKYDLSIGETSSFTKKRVSLRIQNILDPSQEDAKRSHFFDGVALVIEGGPGTGKTTTLIQRIKFLLDKEAHAYKRKLSKEQLAKLLDPEKGSNNWLFLSPTNELLYYLKDNMNSEGLYACDENCMTIDKLRNDMYNAYKLRGNKSVCQFYIMEQTDDFYNWPLFVKPKEVIESFEIFVINQVLDSIRNWETNLIKIKDKITAYRFKSICGQAHKIKGISDLVCFFANVALSEESLYAAKEQEVKDAISLLVSKCGSDIWIRNHDVKKRMALSLYEIEKIEELTANDWNEIDKKILRILTSIVRKIVDNLVLADVNFILSDSEKVLYDIIGSELQERIKYYLREDKLLSSNSSSMLNLIDNCLFVHQYHYLIYGLDSIVFTNIPLWYKEFRQASLNDNNKIYDLSLLEYIIGNGDDNYLHKDELNLMVGLINNIVKELKKWKNCDSFFKHRYINTYLSNSKYVIAIDEATDYSLMDYYFISSFCNHEFSSVSLCGDIMQGLTEDGVKDWHDLSSIIKTDVDITQLALSYRQKYPLVEMAKRMYKDDRGVDAPYSSSQHLCLNDPKPIFFVSKNTDQRILWLAMRIKDIYDKFDQNMPSVAIFVGKNENVKNLINKLKSNNLRQYLNGIKVEDCTDCRIAEGTNNVRIFNIEKVKGMEFEAAIFYNIDCTMDGGEELLRKYIYVGISRASSRLGAVFSKTEGNESIIKYFDQKETNW